MVDWNGIKTKKQWKIEIQALLDRSPAAVERAIVVIYQNQTDEEQSCDGTIEANGVGFSAFDAEFLSSLARQLIISQQLTDRQLAIARNKMKKYWRQLMEIAQAKEK